MSHSFKTGDLLLCDGNSNGFLGFFGNLIKYFTSSNYSHIAMIIVNPSFIDPNLKGTFVWESGWEGTPDPQDGKIKLGVQITPISKFLKEYTGGRVYLRKILCADNVFNDTELKRIHDIVYEKPYDIVPKDWIEAYFHKDEHPQKTDRFWCSALIGYIYTKLNLLPFNTDWSILRPSDFSEKSGELKFKNCIMCDEVLI